MLATLPSFMRCDPDSDFIRLDGSRIGLTDLIRLYNEGLSAEMILLELPTLSLPVIYRTLSYYLDHQSEVDAYVAADDAKLGHLEAECDRQHRAPTLVELRRRLEQVRLVGS